MTTSCIEIILIGFILVLPFLYETSRTFRYYFKFVVYYGIVLANSIFVIPIMLFRPRNVNNFILASSICHRVSDLLGIEWQLRGRENLAKDRACIVISNHQSSLDILGMFKIWPVMGKCTVISRKELFYVWPLGIAAWLCGLIFIDRTNTDKARSALNEATETIKEKKIKLWIFPEGTRRNTGEIHGFKKGAFHAAIKSQLPIVPVVISSYYFLSKPEHRFDQGRVIVTALPAVPTKGLTLDDVTELMEQIHEKMSEVLRESNHEVQQSFLPRKSIQIRE